MLSSIERKRREGVISDVMIVVGVARAGSDRPVVKAGKLRELLTFEFGDAPHILVFPGRLHFMEEEALEVLGAIKNEREQEPGDRDANQEVYFSRPGKR